MIAFIKRSKKTIANIKYANKLLKIAMIFPFVENYTETNERFANTNWMRHARVSVSKWTATTAAGDERERSTKWNFSFSLNCVYAIDVTRDRFK